MKYLELWGFFHTASQAKVAPLSEEDLILIKKSEGGVCVIPDNRRVREVWSEGFGKWQRHWHCRCIPWPFQMIQWFALAILYNLTNHSFLREAPVKNSDYPHPVPGAEVLTNLPTAPTDWGSVGRWRWWMIVSMAGLNKTPRFSLFWHTKK